MASPILDDHFPGELDHYAVGTVGLNIRTLMHRVTSDFYDDTTHGLNKVHFLGFRRPRLVISTCEEVRSGQARSSSYLVWCDRELPGMKPIPVLRLEWVKERPFVDWFRQNRPDAINFVHVSDARPEISKLLRRRQITARNQVGAAVLTHHLEGTGFSGMQQNQALMGAWAVELLVARMMNRDFGIPANPRIELVASRWVNCGSLRRVR